MADHHHHQEKPNQIVGYSYSDVASSSGGLFGQPPEMYNMAATAFGNHDFYSQQHDFNKKHDFSVDDPWQHQHHYNNNDEDDDDPTVGSISLSLSSSAIGLQSFQIGPSTSNSRPVMNIRNSRYLIPAQELLNEFCNIGTKQPHGNNKPHKDTTQEDENALKKHSLFALDLLDLQRRKTKLLHMLEEVDRRYKHYCDQMKGVTSSFESVAGNGAATVYSALASRAMSRHFRCLRDGIVTQIKATNKAMGEKDISVPGTVKGETPRLRVLDQTLRQQKALQQMTLMETHPWRPQRGLPERSVSVLRAWLFEHFLHPYPSDVDKHILARQTGLSRSQVSNWFINARVRLWKPMVEEMYIEELKENEDGGAAPVVDDLQNQNRNEDQKPTHDQLLRMDSECLSSIINNPNKNGYGAMELDFAGGGGGGQNYGGGGVSLTLGLHQHGGGGGVSLAFTTAGQGSLLYPRDHIEDCETVPYSLLDNDENQTLPYRNLMGAQLLQDY